MNLNAGVPMPDAFALKDCAVIAIATGQRAQTLRELQDRLQDVHPGSIYYHFWGGMLNPRFDDPEFQNDFASWAYHGLNDLPLAERLAVIDPTAFVDLEELRRELIEAIEERLDETEVVPCSRAEQQFHFIRSKLVVFDTGVRVEEPRQLRNLIPQLPASSVFYHFIDARRRVSVLTYAAFKDDFSRWLAGFGEQYLALARALAAIDPYFTSLAGLRSHIHAAFEKQLTGH